MISPIREIVIQEWIPESYTVRIDGRPFVPAAHSEELADLLGRELPCIHKMLTKIQELEDDVAKYEDALSKYEDDALGSTSTVQSP